MAYKKWNDDEEEALRAAVLRHGQGNWSKIANDPEFIHASNERSRHAVKQKWKQMAARADVIAEPEHVAAEPEHVAAEPEHVAAEPNAAGAPSQAETRNLLPSAELSSESGMKVNKMVADFKEFMMGFLASNLSDLEREKIVTLCMVELEKMRTQEEAVNVDLTLALGLPANEPAEGQDNPSNDADREGFHKDPKASAIWNA